MRPLLGTFLSLKLFTGVIVVTKATLDIALTTEKLRMRRQLVGHNKERQDLLNTNTRRVLKKSSKKSSSYESRWVFLKVEALVDISLCCIWHRLHFDLISFFISVFWFYILACHPNLHSRLFSCLSQKYFCLLRM